MQRSRIHLLAVLATLAGGSLGGCGGGGDWAGQGPGPAPAPAPGPAPAPAPGPTRRTFAYVATEAQTAIFRVGDDGGLSAAGMVDPVGVSRLVFHPSGKFAYATHGNSSSVAVFNAHPETGLLEFSSSFTAGDRPVSIVIDPTGRFAYVANEQDNSISMCTIDANGALADNGTLAVVDAPFGLAMHPTGSFLLVGTRVNVISLAVDGAGKLSEVDAVGGRVTEYLAISPNGRFAYINNTDSSITTLPIDPVTGDLALPSSADVASGGPLVFNAAGTVAYMAAPNSVALIAFNIDSDTGVYSMLQALQPLPGPNAAAIAPSGAFLFASNLGDNTLSTFAIAGGRLSSFGSPVSLPAAPRSITIASLLA